jgi:hypothetical protein
MATTTWRALVKKLGHLLHSWWGGDRVRIAPAEGRLLRLQPPCLLLIADQPAQVCRRRVCGRRVVYFCRTIAGMGRLMIDRTGVHWRRRRQVKRLRESDIEVFPVT